MPAAIAEPNRSQDAGRAEAVATRSWLALGTSVHVLTTDETLADPATVAAGALLEQVDAAYSRFRQDSELSRLNARPGRSVRISPLFAEAIQVALECARLTDGAVDPTVGRAMRSIGYDRDFDWRPSETGPIVLRLEPIPGWRTVELDRQARTVRLRPGVELDLGSTGKALAADLAAKAGLEAMGRGGVLVSLGGDIATAGTAPSGGWQVMVAEDSRVPPSGGGEVVGLHGGAIATSSTTVRRWSRGGVALHHIVDPQTSLPACSRWRTATVMAGTCVAANAAATATIVKGERGLEWLGTTGLPARLIARNGDAKRLGAWPVPSGNDGARS